MVTCQPAAAAPKVRLCGCCLRLYRPWDAARLCRTQRHGRSPQGPEMVILWRPSPGERMKPIPTDLVFLSARRTPFGTYGGAPQDPTPAAPGGPAAHAALAPALVEPEGN